MMVACGLVLFDLDGTLTDSKPGIINSVKYALESMGVSLPDEDTLKKFVGPPLRNSFKMFCGFDDIKSEEAVAKYREYFAPKGMLENKPYPNVIEVLEGLALKGVIMAVATSKPTVYAEKILNHFDMSRYFSLIVGSELDGTRSDKAEIIAYALDKLNSDRGMKTVMIGDRKHDIIGAKICKIGSIGALWGYGSKAELEEAGADRLIILPLELLR